MTHSEQLAEPSASRAAEPRGKAQPSEQVSPRSRRVIRIAGVIGGAAMVALILTIAGVSVYRSDGAGDAGRGPLAIPVEVDSITRMDVRDLRVLSGTLQPRSRSLIATRIAGRVEEMRVNIGDVVQSGDVIALLDDAESLQAVEESRAELRVAEAALAEHRSMLVIASRNFDRIQRLFNEDIASESELDAVRADHEAKEARVRVSESQVARAEAQLRAAEVRLSYATIQAVWPNSNGPRIIGERFVDAGSTVAANGPIVSLLDIDTLIAVIYVPERDYARLRIGQPVRITSDSYRGESFDGAIVRLAPEFREASRQARVEIELNNPTHRLKPGMFVRAEVELAHANNAVVVPQQAIVRRRGAQGVFMVNESEMTVRFVPVQVGITQDGMVQILNPPDDFSGEVVTLGQHLLDDGSTIRISRDAEPIVAREASR